MQKMIYGLLILGATLVSMSSVEAACDISRRDACYREQRCSNAGSAGGMFAGMAASACYNRCNQDSGC